MLPQIELIAKRNHQHESPHYDIYAGQQFVGVVKVPVPFAAREVWFWAINTVTVDSTVGATMQGYAYTFDAAKADFRKAFEVWLAWAIAMPTWDLKKKGVAENLRKIGVSSG